MGLYKHLPKRKKKYWSSRAWYIQKKLKQVQLFLEIKVQLPLFQVYFFENITLVSLHSSTNTPSDLNMS